MNANSPEVRIPMPTPVTIDDIHKLIGALYLEIDNLRRHIQVLRAHIESNDASSPKVG